MTVAIVHRLLDRLGIPRDRLPAEELYRWEPMRLARMVARLNKRVGRRGIFVACAGGKLNAKIGEAWR